MKRKVDNTVSFRASAAIQTIMESIRNWCFTNFNRIVTFSDLIRMSLEWAYDDIRALASDDTDEAVKRYIAHKIGLN